VASVVLSAAVCFVSYTSNYHAFMNILECVTMAGYSFHAQVNMIFICGHDAECLYQETSAKRSKLRCTVLLTCRLEH
jgi:hypothetical protein